MNKNDIQKIETLISQSIAVKQKLLEKNHLEKICVIANQIEKSLKKGNKLLLCGNGGSAADAQHAAAEFVTRFKIDRRPLAALALTTDTSVLTSIGNDYDYAQIFKKQVEALGRKGDVLIALSTSGRSQNVLEGVQVAKEIGLKTIGFTGDSDNPLSRLSDITFKVPSLEVARIQEAHILAIHIISEIVEGRLSSHHNNGQKIS
ncbi:MAG: SIS domain-containing protein [Chlamydiae bacterium]|nr:SIS domain-containing protein [Chlamydiota bacterium]MBI3267160.1 SIS domain-containing protein [Chlamydiota bacterium]